MYRASLLIFGVLDLEDFQEGGTTTAIDDHWGWYALYVVLAVVGVVAQMQATERQRESLRHSWERGPSTSMTSS